MHMLLWSHTDVSSVSFHVFHTYVAKVDLDVGLLSEEQRASVGVMAASMWGGAGCVAPVWKR